MPDADDTLTDTIDDDLPLRLIRDVERHVERQATGLVDLLGGPSTARLIQISAPDGRTFGSEESAGRGSDA